MYSLAVGKVKTYETAFSSFIHPFQKVLPIEYTLEVHNDLVNSFSINVDRKHDIVSDKTDLEAEIFLKAVILRNTYRDKITHQLGFIEAIEQLYDISDSVPTPYNRFKIILAEFERIKEHFIWFYELFYNSGIIFYNQILPLKKKIDAIFTKDFKIIKDNLNNCLGIGQLFINWTEEQNYSLLVKLYELMEDFSFIKEEILASIKLRNYLFSVGSMDNGVALKTGTVGPIARASALDQDLRIDDPYWDYLSFGDFKIAQSYDQDLYGLVKVLLTEIGVSFDLIHSIIKKDYTLEPVNLLSEIDQNQKGQMTVRLESSKGPSLYSIECKENMIVTGFGLATSGMTNLHSLETRLRNAPVNFISRIIHAYNITELSFIKS